jgi:hypothetical protein
MNKNLPASLWPWGCIGEQADTKLSVFFYIFQILAPIEPKFRYGTSLSGHPDWRYCNVTKEFAVEMSTLGWLLIDDETPTRRIVIKVK